MTVEEWKRKNPPIQRKPMTNADKLRRMTDEELADFMIGAAQRGGKPTNSGLVRWLDWMKQEVEE